MKTCATALVLLAAGWAAAQSPVRIATWNVLGIGARGSAEYTAVLATLERLRPDAVAIQEVIGSGDVANLQNLGADAGYTVVVVPSGNPFGEERNAILSRLPLVRSTVNTSALLSGDPAANDLTRWLVESTLDVPGQARDLTLVSVHLKSGGFDSDEFRRVVEAIRSGQALADLGRAGAYVVMGDLNEEIFAVPRTPDPFRSVPGGMPTGWRLGADLAALLPAGIRNDPFHYLLLDEGPDLSALPARQLDGSEVTRPVSGRRLDYILASPAIAGLGHRAEVYDSQDEGLPGGLPKFGTPPPAGTSAIASDHLLVFADITVPGVAAPVHVVFAAPTQVPGLGLVQPWEAVTYANETNSWSWLFRGGDHGIGQGAIDALAVLPGGRLFLSFADPMDIPGLTGGPGGGTLVDDSDLVEFAPPPTGFIISTSGPARPFTFRFDGSDVGLDADTEDVDAVELLGDGRIVLSTTGAFSVPGVGAGEDVDLIAFTATTLGEHTAGTLEVYFDGGDVGLSAGTGEDVDSAAVASGGSVFLSTVGDVFVPGLSGGNEDVVRFTPTSLGPVTAGTYGMLLDFSALGIDPGADVTAVDTDE